MLRLGIVDCDTSHVYQFARRLNHRHIEPEQWVNGAQVVAAWVGTSRVTPAERVAEYVQLLQETGVTLVDQPEDLLDLVDAVLIESNEGGVHRARATPFLEAGMPVFIDKPLAATVADARALVGLAQERGGALLSASALRFAPEIQQLRHDPALGEILGVDLYAPATLHPANPGLLHYGVHGVEMLYALLGPGCQQVSSHWDERGEIVVGYWLAGRYGVLRGLRQGSSGYGGTAFGSAAIRTVTVDTTWIYHHLLAAIIPALSGGTSPVSGDELIEVVAFQEAALASAQSGGVPVPLCGL